jgi:hypothetical protein
MRFPGFSASVVMLLLSASTAVLAATNPSELIPTDQVATMQPQAQAMGAALVQALKTAEASATAQNLTGAAKAAFIQTALQNAIIQAGYDPRVVLAAIRAITSCAEPDQQTFFDGAITLSCNDLRTALSAEGRQALAALDQTVTAQINQNVEPGAIGGGGSAPLGGTAAAAGGGGSSGYIQ